MRLTKSSVDAAKAAEGRDQVFYRDDLLKGFALRVTANGAKSFIMEKLIDGKVKRMTLGRYGELTVEQARKEAQKLMGKIATGINPLAEKQVQKVKALTLNGVFQEYLKTRKLKPKTANDYTLLFRNVFADWQNKAFLSITKVEITARHTQIGTNNGKAYANLAMRLLRAIYNFAEIHYKDKQTEQLSIENPVLCLSKTHTWYRIARRKTYIRSHQLAAWHQSVMNLKNETLRDYLLLVLFTGLRRNEAASLLWKNIDFLDRTLTAIDTKNHAAHTLPLSDYLYELLMCRKANANNLYVFPGNGECGYIVEPRKQIQLITQETGIEFTMHDLRRTFITMAEKLDISVYALKRLLNHKTEGDVTAGYIIADVERLRKPMQLISEHLCSYFKLEN
jgi:integrase